MSYNPDTFELAEDISVYTVNFTQAVGNYLIYTHINPNTRFSMYDAIFYFKSITGTTTTPPTINIGYTSPNYNDWVSTRVLGTISGRGANNFQLMSQLDTTFVFRENKKSLVNGESLYLRVSSAGTATISATVVIYGYNFPLVGI